MLGLVKLKGVGCSGGSGVVVLCSGVLCWLCVDYVLVVWCSLCCLCVGVPPRRRQCENVLKSCCVVML